MPKNLQRAAISVAAAAALFACDSDAPGGGPSDCGPGTFSVEVVRGDESQTTSGNVTSYAFLNAGASSEGTLEIGTSEGYTLSLRWDETVRNGGSSDAAGALDLGDDGGALGTCADDGYSGTIEMYEEGSGGTFVLPEIRVSSDCASDAIGSASGCFRSPT